MKMKERVKKKAWKKAIMKEDINDEMNILYIFHQLRVDICIFKSIVSGRHRGCY